MSLSTTFVTLPICKRIELTADAFCLTLAVPAAVRQQFEFVPGQYVTVRRTEKDQSKDALRRSYSICSSAAEYARTGEFSVGIKRVTHGQFTESAHAQLQVGQTLDVLPPAGRFVMHAGEQHGHHLAIAAGSGITPILSIMQAVLAGSARSQFTLVYGNRSSNQVMFLEALEALKNQYMTRVKLIHVLSAQPQEVDLFNGRIDRAKVTQLLGNLMPANTVDVAWLCGPDSLIDQAEQALLDAGVARTQIRSERFGQPSAVIRVPAVVNTRDEPHARLTVIADGKAKTMPLAYRGASVLDTALAAGMDLPYACKGGVCCTCRAKVTEGQVQMLKNYTLEAWEVAKGFVLTCQCQPLTEKVTVSFDER
jgi:ring-1,2-phenylacetyl-CoA epoxidase subunit PaaE